MRASDLQPIADDDHVESEGSPVDLSRGVSDAPLHHRAESCSRRGREPRNRPPPGTTGPPVGGAQDAQLPLDPPELVASRSPPTQRGGKLRRTVGTDVRERTVGR